MYPTHGIIIAGLRCAFIKTLFLCRKNGKCFGVNYLTHKAPPRNNFKFCRFFKNNLSGMIYHVNRLLADNSHEISYLFFRKLKKISPRLSSAAVMIGTLRINKNFIFVKKEGQIFWCELIKIGAVIVLNILMTRQNNKYANNDHCGHP